MRRNRPQKLDASTPAAQRHGGRAGLDVSYGNECHTEDETEDPRAGHVRTRGENERAEDGEEDEAAEDEREDTPQRGRVDTGFGVALKDFFECALADRTRSLPAARGGADLLDALGDPPL